MRHKPLNFAIFGVLVALIWILATLMLAPPAAVDAGLVVQALVVFPALVGSFMGMVAAGIIYFRRSGDD